jgi:hypothetical protein
MLDHTVYVSVCSLRLGPSHVNIVRVDGAASSCFGSNVGRSHKTTAKAPFWRPVHRYSDFQSNYAGIYVDS